MIKDFLDFQAQTSCEPLIMEVERANGSYIYNSKGNAYLDFVAGVSANTLGHNHPKVSKAIIDQVQKYTHVMVYGEFVQSPSVCLSKKLVQLSPESLNCVYLTNTGAEATEGAIKLAKRVTGRYQVISAINAYHGNTQGAMSVCGQEGQNRAFRPLIPGIHFIRFNYEQDLEKITTKTAAVILETIQGGAGFIEPENDFLKKVRQCCDKMGALLILDEIQTGIGRTGKFWGFEHYECIPDIIITGKGLGGGMPIGAFIASREYMAMLKHKPKLGHITTFGGHPVTSAAALAVLEEVNVGNLQYQINEKEKLIRMAFQGNPKIKEIRGKGLMLALIVSDSDFANKVILECFRRGLLLFWLLFEGRAIRITPSLMISKEEIKKGCKILNEVLNDIE